MPSLTALAPRLVQRARADPIATLFTQWPVATGSMVLGATILSTVMWGTVAPRLFAAWMGAMLISGDSSTEAISAMREASPHVLLKPVLPQELHLLVERLLTQGDEATAVERFQQAPS